jgi:DNA-directed RNA polymerase specialized sigma24 family protein
MEWLMSAIVKPTISERIRFRLPTDREIPELISIGKNVGIRMLNLSKFGTTYLHEIVYDAVVDAILRSSNHYDQKIPYVRWFSLRVKWTIIDRVRSTLGRTKRNGERCNPQRENHTPFSMLDEQGMRAVENMLASSDDNIADPDSSEDIKRRLKQLTQKELFVVLKSLDGHKFKDICLMMECSESRICQLFRDAMKKMEIDHENARYFILNLKGPLPTPRRRLKRNEEPVGVTSNA